MDENPDQVKAFLVGGTFTKEDGNTTELKGVFSEMESEVAKYSKYGSVLDTFKESVTHRLSRLTEQKDKAVDRLDVSYATMAKKFAAYDMIISKRLFMIAMICSLVEDSL